MTKAQKALLEGLVAGEELREHCYLGHYVYLGYVRVHVGAFKSVKRRGWIVDNAHNSYALTRVYTITAAGRAALKREEK